MQSTSWLFENSEFDSYGKNMKEKVNDSVRLHKAMQEKLKTATYSEQIQIRTLVPGLEWTVQNILMTWTLIPWILIPCLNFTWNKKVGGILEKPSLQKRNTTTTETLYLVTNVYEDDNFGR